MIHADLGTDRGERYCLVTFLVSVVPISQRDANPVFNGTAGMALTDRYRNLGGRPCPTDCWRSYVGAWKGRSGQSDRRNTVIHPSVLVDIGKVTIHQREGIVDSTGQQQLSFSNRAYGRTSHADLRAPHRMSVSKRGCDRENASSHARIVPSGAALAVRLSRSKDQTARRRRFCSAAALPVL